MVFDQAFVFSFSFSVDTLHCLGSTIASRDQSSAFCQYNCNRDHEPHSVGRWPTRSEQQRCARSCSSWATGTQGAGLDNSDINLSAIQPPGATVFLRAARSGTTWTLPPTIRRIFAGPGKGHPKEEDMRPTEVHVFLDSGASGCDGDRGRRRWCGWIDSGQEREEVGRAIRVAKYFLRL